MPWENAVIAVQSRAETLWPSIEPDVALAVEDTNFQPPSEPRGTLKPWVLIMLDWSGGEFLSIGSPGSNIARREGHVWIHAFVPEGTRAERAHQIAARAAAMFEGQDFDNVVCQAAMPGGAARADNGNYFGQSVAIPFTFDETA